MLWLLPGSDIHSNLVKVQGLLSGYVPLGGHSVLALSARAGKVFPLDDRSRTIVPRRFFLGGASTIRGYGEEQMILVSADMPGVPTMHISRILERLDAPDARQTV